MIEALTNQFAVFGRRLAAAASEDEKIRMRIPLHFLNESTSVGVKQQGGVASHLRNDIEVLCLPKDLPEFVEVDLLELGLGQLIHLSELKLPEGVELPELIHGNDLPVVSIHAQRAEEVADALAENRPVITMESTLITHGLPYPQNIEVATLMETKRNSPGASCRK